VDLDEAIASGLSELPEGEQETAQAQHQGFLDRFPPEAWEDMPLVDYALGADKSKQSFCYALEWGTPVLGSIRGGTSAKHVIFRRRVDGAWHYPASYDSVDEAWTALREGYRTALALAQEGRWAEINEIPALERPRVSKLKTLYLYNPGEVLPVYSKPHLEHFAEKVGATLPDDFVGKNRALLEHLRTVPGLEQVSGLGLARLLYRWQPPAGFDTPVWLKVAPGKQAVLWQECLDGEYICVGWDDVGDLTLFDDEEQFRAAFAEAYPHGGNASTATRKARELWRFGQLRPGDRVVANKGTAEVMGIGTVRDTAYEYREARVEYRHCVAVDWDVALAQKLDPPVKQWATTTVLPVRGPLQARLLGAAAGPVVPPLTLPVPEPDFLEWERTLRRKGQLVFYGPPGTGKTRNARAFARWWLTKELGLDLSEYPTTEELDDHLQYRGHCRRTWVWHMPKGVEWSVGALQAAAPPGHEQPHSGDLVVCWGAGEQRVVGLARVVSLHGDNEDEVALLPLRQLPLGPGSGDLAGEAGLKGSSTLQPGISGLRPLTVSESQRLLAVSGVSARYAQPEPEELASYLTQVTFHASYSYEDFLEGYRPVPGDGDGLRLELRDGLMIRIARTARADGDTPYLLLVDEMNRANTPRVFGELMTVLERDKRGMAITLPTSGRDLVLPANVYMIGTMNTSDRSIRTLDAALRRRFAFIEVLPDSSPLDGAVVEDLALNDFLDELNRRVTKVAGREKQIGQSYLLHEDKPIDDVESLAEVLRLEVIPLLQEIAFDDYGRLQEFLGPDVVDAETQRLRAVVDDPSALVAALVKEYQQPQPS
jgi:5-methylcytosine-specific restriction protein B